MTRNDNPTRITARLRSLRVLASAIVLAATVVARAATPTDCSDFEWNMTHELDLFRTTAHPVRAASEIRVAPRLDAEQLYEVTLTAQDGVHFAVTPQGRRVVEGAHAGVVRIGVPAGGHYRLSASGPVWVDAVADGEVVPANSFNGHSRCTLIHKSVDYTLRAGSELVVQFSQSPSTTVRFALTAVPATP